MVQEFDQYALCKEAKEKGWEILKVKDDTYCEVNKLVPKTITKDVNATVTVQRCCPGYEGENCANAVCSSPCMNQGKCIGPNLCDCGDSGYGGPTCSDRKLTLFHQIPLQITIPLGLLGFILFHR